MFFCGDTAIEHLLTQEVRAVVNSDFCFVTRRCCSDHMPGAGAAFDGGGVQAVDVQLIADLGQEL